MPRPYSMDLRERVVNACKEGGSAQREVAERFGVGLQTVVRWVGRERRTGSVAPSPMGGGRHSHLVDEAGATLLRDILDCVPDTTLRDLSEVYEESRGVRISTQTMSDTVRRLGYTRKKGSFVRGRPIGRTS